MREVVSVLSFQSPEVSKIIFNEGVYRAKKELCREGPYLEDIEQLNGSIPIWGYCVPLVYLDTMATNYVLENMRCEMSLGQRHCFDNFELLELHIPKSMVKVGKGHNGNSKCVIFPEISKNMVVGLYDVRDSKHEGWYYKTIKQKYKTTSVMPDYVDTYELVGNTDWSEDNLPTLAWLGKPHRCFGCSASTSVIYLGHHLCSPKCLYKTRGTIFTTAFKENFKGNYIELYSNASEDIDYRDFTTL